MWGNLNNFVDKAREMGEKALEEVKKKAAEMNSIVPIDHFDEIDIYVIQKSPNTSCSSSDSISSELIVLPNDFTLHMFKDRYWDHNGELILYFGRTLKVVELAKNKLFKIVEGSAVK